MVQSQAREFIPELVTYAFPRAKQCVCDEFGGGRGESPSEGLVLGGVLTSSGSVDILEDLIESELAEALSGVSDKGGGPADGEALETLSGVDLFETVADTGVKTRVSLKE